MKKILIVVDAPGPAEFIAPVIPLLQKSFRLNLITVKESPTKILADYRPIVCKTEADAQSLYKKLRPDILLVAMSSLVLGPYVNQKFVQLANQDGKKIISFQDFWANHRWPMNFKIIKYLDAISVPDFLAQKFILEDGYQGKIVITGNPAMDKFQNIDVMKERVKLRKKFKIPENSFVILHVGTGTPQTWPEDEITFKFLSATVRKLKKKYDNIILMSRPHPRDENPNRYQKIAPDLNLVDTSKKIKLTETILPLADIVLAMYSTNLIHACNLRIPAISILLPDAGKKRLEKISLVDFPLNSVGATIGIYKKSIKILENEIEKIMKDQRYRQAIRKNQQQFCPTIRKEKAAENVAATIMNLT